MKEDLSPALEGKVRAPTVSTPCVDCSALFARPRASQRVRCATCSTAYRRKLHRTQTDKNWAAAPVVTVPCGDCGVQLEVRALGGIYKKSADGVKRCRPCQRKYANTLFETRHGTKWEKYFKGNPLSTQIRRKYKLDRLYGMTIEQYNTLLERQGGVCALCKKHEGVNLCVDHDHVTGDVRGLLCGPCNRALGQMRDSVPLLQAGIHYLMRTSQERSWDAYFIQIAALVATRSKDPSTQVGAVLVQERTIIATGYNGFPRGVNDADPALQERSMKYLWTVHAEENCLLASARHGVRTEGSTLYVTPLFPCARCAPSIVQAGVVEVVCTDHLRDNPRWKDEFEQSTAIFTAAGVKFRTPA